MPLWIVTFGMGKITFTAIVEAQNSVDAIEMVGKELRAATNDDFFVSECRAVRGMNANPNGSFPIIQT